MTHDDFAEQDYNLLNATGISQEESLGVISDRANGSSCSQDDCPLGPDPAEDAWIELMTAIPKERSARIDIKALLSDSPMPEPHVMDEIIKALRREGREHYSIEAIRLKWEQEIYEGLEPVAGDLKVMLKELSHHWVGGDFDVFEEHINQIITALNTTRDSVELLTAELADQEDTIFHMQGGDSGEVPFPAPTFYDADVRKEDADVHVRPPFWDSGDCRMMTKEDALALVGGDVNAPDDFHHREEARVEEIIEERLAQMTPQEQEAQHLGDLEREAQAQAREEIQPEIDEYRQEVQAGQLGESERLSQEVISNRDQVDSTLATSKFSADPVEIEHQDFTEQANGPSYGGLTSPGPASSPDASGMLEPGGHTPGSSPSVSEVQSARSGSGGAGGDEWTMPQEVDEDDEYSDGLFSGSGGGGGGMGTATAPSPSAGSPGGAGGGMPGGGAGMMPGGRGSSAGSGGAGSGRGSGGSGRGGGAGAGAGGRGAGAGAGGRAGGMPMGMMGGAPSGAGGQGQGNDKKNQGRTVSSMGRPTAGAAGGTPGMVGAGGPAGAAGKAKGKEDKAEKKEQKYKSPLAAALERRQAEKDAQKNQPSAAEPTEVEHMDFHDEFDIEEDLWGAHSARKDEYR